MGKRSPVLDVGAVSFVSQGGNWFEFGRLK
jgi:hypothetical protein